MSREDGDFFLYLVRKVKLLTAVSLCLRKSQKAYFYLIMICFYMMYILTQKLSENVPKTFHECQKSKFMSINNFGGMDQ